MSLVDRYADGLADDLAEGASLGDAIRNLTLAHAEHLRALGPVRVLALDPCPRCSGTVLGGDSYAMCSAGCGWSYRRPA